LQYLPFLENEGVEVDVHALITDPMLRERYRGQRYSTSKLIGAYFRRVETLLQRSRYDILWVEKEALPWWPLWTERVLYANVPYILDYDDAVFHNYDLHSKAWVRRFFGRRLDGLMAGAAAVIAGNNYLAERATAAGAASINVVPTVVDTTEYVPRGSSDRGGNRLQIVWIGSPSTQQYLELVYEPLRLLAKRYAFVFRVIGGENVAVPGVDTEYVGWCEETEREQIRECSVGIMPLSDTPWERGKCGYKLIQYMACGLPVVASPVGVNREIVDHGVSGLLAETDADWISGLELLLADAETRARMGLAGRKRVEEYYSLAVQGPRILQILTEVASE
jgi:glycosyltransferase involved in cell wall biosynthesis